jgi:hypothetical protein
MTAKGWKFKIGDLIRNSSTEDVYLVSACFLSIADEKMYNLRNINMGIEFQTNGRLIDKHYSLAEA